MQSCKAKRERSRVCRVQTFGEKGGQKKGRKTKERDLCQHEWLVIQCLDSLVLELNLVHLSSAWTHLMVCRGFLNCTVWCPGSRWGQSHEFLLLCSVFSLQPLLTGGPCMAYCSLAYWTKSVTFSYNFLLQKVRPSVNF